MSGDEQEPDTAFSEAQIRAITSVIEGVLEKARQNPRRGEKDAPQDDSPGGNYPPTDSGELGPTKKKEGGWARGPNAGRPRRASLSV